MVHLADLNMDSISKLLSVILLPNNNNNSNNTKVKPIHYTASPKTNISLLKSTTMTIMEFFNRIVLRKQYGKSHVSEVQVNSFKLSILCMSWVF